MKYICTGGKAYSLKRNSVQLLTNLRRKVFSRRAPMHPAKPNMNITPPTTRKSQTGSKPPRSVMEEMLDRTPFGSERERKKRWESGKTRNTNISQMYPGFYGHSPLPFQGKNEGATLAFGISVQERWITFCTNILIISCKFFLCWHILGLPLQSGPQPYPLC